MTRKLPAGKTTLSLIVDAEVRDVISAVAKLHGTNLNSVAGELLAQFAKKNSAAVGEVEKMKKSAEENFPLQIDLDFGGNSAQ